MGKQSARRTLKFDRLQDSLEEMRSLHESGYDMVGNWDLSKVCQHLTKTLRMSIEGAPFSLPFFLKPITRWILFRSVMEGRPTRLPLKTVRQFLPDDSGMVVKDMADYELYSNKVVADDAPLIANHPVFGRLSQEEWLRFHAWHAAHHLSFLLPRSAAQAESHGAKQTEAVT